MMCNCNNDEAIQCKCNISVPSSTLSNVVTKMVDRERVGKAKYGVTMDRTDLQELEWLNHLHEELMDAVLYLQKVIDERTIL